MTVVVLAASGEPYGEWLAGVEHVVITGDPTSTAVEHEVLALAARRPVTAIVATDPVDLIRAGALRDWLGLPGEGRDDAIGLRDLLVQRRRLAAFGVPVVPVEPVLRVADLYWYVRSWDAPVVVRQRRTADWPVVATLRTEDDVRAFTAGGLAPKLEAVPPLVAEPLGGVPATSVELADRALEVLNAGPGHEYSVLLRSVDGAVVVDAVRVRSGVDAVRAQAGLLPVAAVAS